MRRFVYCDPQESQFHEILARDFISLERIEEVNGEHAIRFKTEKALNRGDRVMLFCDDGAVREYVIVKADLEHSGTSHLYTDYYAVWSLQADLEVTRATVNLTAATAAEAMGAVVQGTGASETSGTARWTVEVDGMPTTHDFEVYHVSGWDAVSEIVKVYGGEVDAVVSVFGGRITERAARLTPRLGRYSANRRFVWGRSLKSISRSVLDTPICCAIVPLGKTTEEEDVKTTVTIESVAGTDTIIDNDMASKYRVWNGSEWEFPVCFAENSEIEDPQELYDWGLSVLYDYTRPKVSYDGSVYAFFGGESTIGRLWLGDSVQMIDTEFDASGLRLSGRIMRIVTDELNPRNVDVTLDNLKTTMADLL